jgi:hypothetical protein
MDIGIYSGLTGVRRSPKARGPVPPRSGLQGSPHEKGNCGESGHIRKDDGLSKAILGTCFFGCLLSHRPAAAQAKNVKDVYATDECDVYSV